MSSGVSLILISSNEDVISVKEPYCIICLEKKINAKVLKKWPIDLKEAVRLKNTINTRIINIICECR